MTTPRDVGGRPPKEGETLTKRRSVLLLPSEDARLIATATKCGVSVNSLMRSLITLGMDDMNRK